ncbi:MAG: hypothetical protein DRR08_16090 [Candidatus Parabeggiatoa sp. nov. 2]|nr:MAG: hypothetical protein B6247_19230 [Beggiatoa sp. 4572_84]RKZ58565.1 MAG: hypothetical protein DRR08_16090 [Gammaproteobacteria bacterium]
MKNRGKSIAILVLGLLVGCVVSPEQKNFELEERKVKLKEEELKLKQEQFAFEKEKQRRRDVLGATGNRENEEKGTCTALYDIFQECYKQGKGKKVEVCADLTLSLVENLASEFKDNQETLTSFSLMCGKACAYGSQGRAFPAFSIFKRKICP